MPPGIDNKKNKFADDHSTMPNPLRKGAEVDSPEWIPRNLVPLILN